MTRTVALNALKQGINRLRDKGGADPESLYDLENGYVTLSGTIQSRPGTTAHATLPAGTKGLCAFDGALVVFSNAAKTVPAGYSCEIIISPDDPALEVYEIHYAGPFLGYLYVAAEFTDGHVYHYWLQRRDAWQASTNYKLGDVVEPTVRNGYAYRAHRLGDPAVVWAANAPRAIGDVVEPTTPNGFEYTVIDTIGTSPRSGTVEPDWPAEDGATINEDADLTAGTATTTGTTTPSTTTVPADTLDRYGKLRDGFGGLKDPL